MLVARCGAGRRLKRRNGRKQRLGELVFSLRCADAICRCCFWPLSFSGSLAHISFGLLSVCVMFESLDQTHPLCRCYSVHVAAQLSHTLLKACTLNGEERMRRSGLWEMKAHYRSTALHLGRVCNKSNDKR